MAARRNNPRLRRIILGVLFMAYAVGAIVLLALLAPGSDDPRAVGRLLGGVAGGLGFIGIAMLVWGLLTPAGPRTRSDR